MKVEHFPGWLEITGFHVTGTHAPRHVLTIGTLKIALWTSQGTVLLTRLHVCLLAGSQTGHAPGFEQVEDSHAINHGKLPPATSKRHPGTTWHLPRQ